jgi:hypothetical protein
MEKAYALDNRSLFDSHSHRTARHPVKALTDSTSLHGRWTG